MTRASLLYPSILVRRPSCHSLIPESEHTAQTLLHPNTCHWTQKLTGNSGALHGCIHSAMAFSSGSGRCCSVRKDTFAHVFLHLQSTVTMKVASGCFLVPALCRGKCYLKKFKLILLSSRHWLRSCGSWSLTFRTYHVELDLIPQRKFKPFHHWWILIAYFMNSFSWLEHLLTHHTHSQFSTPMCTIWGSNGSQWQASDELDIGFYKWSPTSILRRANISCPFSPLLDE